MIDKNIEVEYWDLTEIYFKHIFSNKLNDKNIFEIQNKPVEYSYNKIRMLADPYPNSYIKTVDGKKLIIKVAEINEF